MNSFENIMERAAELQSLGQAYALVTVIKTIAPTSANVGDKALITAEGRIHGWIGGGCAQPAVVRTVKRCIDDARPRHIRITPEKTGEQAIEDVIEFGMPCQSGGTIELFVDPVMAKSEIVVLGESPVAEALTRIAPHIGFHVIWLVDSDLETSSARILPSARSREIRPGAYVVVATQGLHDISQLKLALTLQARHVAFVASRRKAQVLKESLLDAGMDPVAVNAIEAPAGHPINAKTPEEIALSILASLVSRSRGNSDQGTHSGHKATAEPASTTASKPFAATSINRQAATASCCSGSPESAGAAENMLPENKQPTGTQQGSCCSHD
jgi:xanthine dehydrogenase accessory factor